MDRETTEHLTMTDRPTMRLTGVGIVCLALTLGAVGCLPLSPGTLGESCEDDSDCFRGQRCAERNGETVCVASDDETPDVGDDADTERGSDADAGMEDTGDAGMEDTGDGGMGDTDGGGDTDPGPPGYSVEGTVSAGGFCKGTDGNGTTYTVRGNVSYAPGQMSADDGSGYSVRMTRQQLRENQ